MVKCFKKSLSCWPFSRQFGWQLFVSEDKKLKEFNMKKENILKKLALKAKNKLISNNNSSIEYKFTQSDDREFTDKVRELLKTEDIINPISQLMENKILFRLDERGKEKYLLETVDRYLKAIKIIENENVLQ